MTQSLSWNLHGNDQLSSVLEKLDRTVSTLGRQMNSAAGQAREYGRAIGSAEGPSARFHGTVQTTSGHLDGLMGRLTSAGMAFARMGAAAAAAGIAAAGAGAMFGIKTAAATEQAMISFEKMLGSAEKAKAFMGQLADFATKTPFEFAGLRSTASQLLVVGTRAEDIIPILTTLGEATSGMNTGAEGLQRAVLALTQMQLKAKVTGEEMMQLSEAGVPLWEGLAEVLGTDVAGAMKLVETGTVSADKAFQALTQRAGPKLQSLAGLMDAQSRTLAGKWSNFTDVISIKLGKMFEPALPGLGKMLDATAAGIDTTLNKLQSMAADIRGIFAGSDVPERIMNSLRELRDKVLPKLGEAWDKIVKTVSDNREGLEKLGRFIADIIIPAIGTALPVAIDLVTQTIQTWIVALSKVVDAIRFMVGYWLGEIQLILTGAEKAFGWVPGLGDKLRTAKADFDNFANGVMDKLNALDGHTVNVNVAYHEYRAGERYSPSDSATTTTYSSGGQIQEFAYGGMVQGPPGSAQIVKAHAGEEIRTPAQQRADDGNLGTIEVILQYPDGYVVHQALLSHKRRRGLSSLGLA